MRPTSDLARRRLYRSTDTDDEAFEFDHTSEKHIAWGKKWSEVQSDVRKEVLKAMATYDKIRKSRPDFDYSHSQFSPDILKELVP